MALHFQPRQLLILSILIAVLLIVSGYSEGSTNQPPVFLEEVGDVKNFRDVIDREIPENFDPGDIGDPISAMDADGDKITYSLTGEEARKFWINKDTGQLSSREYFDYENTNAYLLTVEASDGQDATQIDVVVFINNRPEFNTTRLPFIPYIFEHYDYLSNIDSYFDSFALRFGIRVIHQWYSNTGLNLFEVGDDIGEPIVSSGVVENPDNEDVTFELSSNSKYYNHYLDIDPDSGQLSIKSKIDFEKHLDRKSRRGNDLVLPIRILMLDNYGIADAIVGCIMVRNLDEGPRIQNSDPYIIQIEENKFFKNNDDRRIISAVDPEGSSFIYKKIEAVSEHAGGIISLAETPDPHIAHLIMTSGGSFDYETHQEYIYRVTVEDTSEHGFTHSIQVVFDITDVDD